MSILFLQGVGDNGLGHLGVDRNGRTNLILDGSCNVSGMMDFQGVTIHKTVMFGNSVEQNPLHLKKLPSLIFNEIADPDTHAGALQRSMLFCQDTGVPVINAADKVQRTTRDQVAQLLQGISNVHMPQTIRFRAGSPAEAFGIAKSAGMGLPAIMRIAGDHGGKSMVLLRDAGDIDKLNVFPFGEHGFYLTEYVDYKDLQGVFQKQRIVFVDGEPIARHSVFDTCWNVHASSRNKKITGASCNDELERTLMLESTLIPKARKALEEIARRMELDYFGLDCCIDEDGKVLVFEANANMNMLFNIIPELEPRIDLIKDKLCAMMMARSGEKLNWVRGTQI